MAYLPIVGDRTHPQFPALLMGGVNFAILSGCRVLGMGMCLKTAVGDCGGGEERSPNAQCPKNILEILGFG